MVVGQIVRPALPASARMPCRAPVALPERALTAAEVASGWSADRAGLIACEGRRAAAVAAVDAVGEVAP